MFCGDLVHKLRRRRGNCGCVETSAACKIKGSSFRTIFGIDRWVTMHCMQRACPIKRWDCDQQKPGCIDAVVLLKPDGQAIRLRHMTVRKIEHACDIYIDMTTWGTTTRTHLR